MYSSALVRMSWGISLLGAGEVMTLSSSRLSSDVLNEPTRGQMWFSNSTLNAPNKTAADPI